LVVGPVNHLIKFFDEAASGEGDLSKDLKAITHDEFRTLANSFNNFLYKFRHMISAIRESTIVVATQTAKVTKILK